MTKKQFNIIFYGLIIFTWVLNSIAFLFSFSDLFLMAYSLMVVSNIALAVAITVWILSFFYRKRK